MSQPFRWLSARALPWQQASHDRRTVTAPRQFQLASVPIVSCLNRGAHPSIGPKLCHNPIQLECRELLFEREQLPQVVDIRHIRIKSMERLEPANKAT